MSRCLPVLAALVIVGAIVLRFFPPEPEPEPSFSGLHMVNLSPDESRIASSLSRRLTGQYVAVPDSIIMSPGALRITFVHAPFSPWIPRFCKGTHAPARVVAFPTAEVVWDAFHSTVALRKITLVARAGRQVKRDRFGFTSCGPGEAAYDFYPEDFNRRDGDFIP